MARRPPSAYNLFFSEASVAAKARPLDGAGAGDLCTYLAEQWRALDVATKAGYRRRSEAIRKQYQQTKVWSEESPEGRDAAMAPPHKIPRGRPVRRRPAAGEEGPAEPAAAAAPAEPPRPVGRPRRQAAQGPGT